MCLQGTYLSDYYLRVAKSLQIMEPKKPADIYKSQFETVISSSSSSKDYISSTYVNAFVNAGFKEDSMVLTKDKNSNQSVISSKGKSSVSITAALGMVLMWSDSETSAEIILEYLSSENNTIKAGALLALGLNSVGLRQESDLTKALAGDYLEETSVSDSSENQVKRAGLLSLGIAYAKTGDREVTEILTKFLHPEKRSIRTISFAALSLGLVHLGSGNAEVISILLDVLREMRPQDLTHTYTRFIILGLALTAMCRRDVVIFDSKSPNEEDAPTDITSTYINVTDLGDPVKMQAKVLVGACSMAGSGEVLE
ncbi:proteasome regulatory particle base subunit, partial [Spiromyces aspiralis]